MGGKMEKEKTQVWLAGVSTDIEVDRLNKAFPNLKIGDRFTDEDLEIILELEKDSQRFSTVMDRWRRYCQNRKNLLITRDRITGYHVADDNERTEVAEDTLEKAVGRIDRAVKILHGTDKYKLDEPHLKKHDHISICLGSIKSAYIAEKRKVKVLPPVASEANRILKKSDEDEENNV
jgi:hypothetical protein